MRIYASLPLPGPFRVSQTVYRSGRRRSPGPLAFLFQCFIIACLAMLAIPVFAAWLVFKVVQAVVLGIQDNRRERAL